MCLPSTKQMRRNVRESLVKFRGGYLEKISMSLFNMIVSEAVDLLICLIAYFRRGKKRTGEMDSCVKTTGRFTSVFHDSNESMSMAQPELSNLNSTQEENHHSNFNPHSREDRVKQPLHPRLSEVTHMPS